MFFREKNGFFLKFSVILANARLISRSRFKGEYPRKQSARENEKGKIRAGFHYKIYRYAPQKKDAQKGSPFENGVNGIRGYPGQKTAGKDPSAVKVLGGQKIYKCKRQRRNNKEKYSLAHPLVRV